MKTLVIEQKFSEERTNIAWGKTLLFGIIEVLLILIALLIIFWMTDGIF